VNERERERVCVYVCVCVGVTERERERESEDEAVCVCCIARIAEHYRPSRAGADRRVPRAAGLSPSSEKPPPGFAPRSDYKSRPANNVRRRPRPAE